MRIAFCGRESGMEVVEMIVRKMTVLVMVGMVLMTTVSLPQSTVAARVEGKFFMIHFIIIPVIFSTISCIYLFEFISCVDQADEF